MIHLYARVSTDKQENGREAQEQRLRDWVKDQPHTLWVEEDASAYSIRLNARPAGKQMCDALQAGDTVVITKVDRVFRRMYDFAVTREKWEKLGVELVILDLPQLSGPHGKFFLSVVVASGELESDMHSQRKQEVYHHKRKMGQPYARTRPYGWKVVKTDGKMTGWEPLPYERSLGQEVLAMRAAGKSWSEIANAVCLRGVRKFSPCASGERYYHAQDLQRLARAAAAQYPVVPQAFWQGSDCEQRLLAAKADGWRLSP